MIMFLNAYFNMIIILIIRYEAQFSFSVDTPNSPKNYFIKDIVCENMANNSDRKSLNISKTQKKRFDLKILYILCTFFDYLYLVKVLLFLKSNLSFHFCLMNFNRKFMLYRKHYKQSRRTLLAKKNYSFYAAQSAETRVFSARPFKEKQNIFQENHWLLRKAKICRRRKNYS